MNKEFIKQARIFKAMSDENRLKILDLLRENEYNAGQILEKMEFGQSTLSHHMKLLTNAGIVNARRQGKWMYYTLNQETYQQIIDWLEIYKTA